MSIRVANFDGSFAELARPAERIVSLVPSESETLHYLGAEDKIVGITEFCVRPWSMYKTTTHVDGPKDPNIERIRWLEPDLILCNKEENEKDAVEELREIAPVHVSFVVTVEEAAQLIADLGALTGCGKKAKQMQAQIARGRKTVAGAKADYTFRRVLHLVWKDPYMTVSPDTYIYDLLTQAGLEPVVPRIKKRYPMIDEDFIREYDPGAVFFPDEPYRFTFSDIDEFREQFAELSCVRNDGLFKVDGATVTWFGYRTTVAFEYIAKVMRLP
jgi:ABC-type Fe3+-hydroxamate transport system substrate-binding protein